MNKYLSVLSLSLWPACLAAAVLILPVARNLEYEFWLLQAAGLSLLTPWLAWSLKAAGLASPSLSRGLWLLPIASTILPASLLFLTGDCMCSSPNYLTWAVIQGLPALALGLGLSFWVWTGLRGWQLAGLQIGLLGLTALEMWFLPQKRSTSLLLGFLHGPIYDDLILLDAGIVWQRIAHACLGLALIAAFRPQASMNKTRTVLPVLLISLASLSFALSRYSMSASLGHRSLMSHLHHSFALQGATLYVSHQLDGNSQRVKQFREELAFHLDELRQYFPEAEPTKVYLYASDNEKKLLFGGGSTDVADVVGPSIHLNLDTSPHPTLRHELVHALAAKTAFKGLGFHPNMAFTEGLAVALSPSDRAVSLDEGVLSLLQTNRLPDIETLFSPLFWQVSGRRAYSVAGSFISFLMQRFGFDAVHRLYQGEAWDSVLPEPLPRVIDVWLAHLQTQSAQINLAAEELYRYPGILSDVCPHTKALFRSKNLHPLNQLRSHPHLKNRSTYWSWLAQAEPDNPQLKLANLSAKAKSDRANPSALSALRRKLANLITWPPKTIEDIEIKLLNLDLAYLLDPNQHKDELLQLSQELSPFKVRDSIKRAIGARILIDRLDLAQERRTAWRDYLAGLRALPKRQNTPQNQGFDIRDYLYMLAQPKSEPLPASLAEVEDYFYSQLPSSLARPLSYRWYLTAAKTQDLKGYTDNSILLYQQALRAALPGQRQLVQQNIRRLLWVETLRQEK